MNFNCSKELQDEFAKFVKDKINQKCKSYVACGCEDSVNSACETSGTYNKVKYHKELKDTIKSKLNCNIGDKKGKNNNGGDLVVGVCAEQHAANSVLFKSYPNEDKTIDIAKELRFTKAVRLKSKYMDAEFPACSNCMTIFS